MRTDRTQPLLEQPKYRQTWRTHLGHRVRILLSALPGPRRVIETEYVGGPVHGRRGINFDLNGNAVLGEDWLVEREK